MSQQRGVAVGRGSGGVLERCHARFVPGEGYLARDGIKYLRSGSYVGLGGGAGASGTGDGAQPKGSSCKV